jgi:hypothetical protein
VIAVDSLALGILDADLVDFARSLSDASTLSACCNAGCSMDSVTYR